MARKRKNNNTIELLSLIPWWISIGLALLSYIILHHYAAIEIPLVIPLQNNNLQIPAGNLLKNFMLIGQYILPFLLLIGAVASFLKKQKRKELIHRAAENQSGNALLNMSWHEFELLVGEAFRMLNFSVTETGGGGADGGIDLKLYKGNELFLVQCKQWRAFKVSVSIVRELYGVMASEGAAGGYVVTSGTFTQDAENFAKGKNIQLIDGIKLSKMIQNVHSTRSQHTKIITQPIEHAIPLTEQKTANDTPPQCPRCGALMVKRTATQGANIGQQFWGCSTYPACNKTLSIKTSKS